MAPSRISLTLLRGLIQSGAWKHNIAVVASSSGGDYKVCRK